MRIFKRLKEGIRPRLGDGNVMMETDIRVSIRSKNEGAVRQEMQAISRS